MAKRERETAIDLESLEKLRREVDKIPPQKAERAARSLADLKTAIERLERDAKPRRR